MAAVTGLHRKSLVRLLQQPSLERRRSTTRRRRSYGLEVEQVVAIVWEAGGDVLASKVVQETGDVRG